jgi:hypothetical protein
MLEYSSYDSIGNNPIHKEGVSGVITSNIG